MVDNNKSKHDREKNDISFSSESEYKDVIEKLHVLLEHQTYITEILQQLQVTNDLTAAIDGIIADLGLYCGASSVTIFEFSPDGKLASNTFEWCNEGIPKTIEQFQNIPYESFTITRELFDKDKTICANSFEELPAEIAAIFPYRDNAAILFVNMEYYGNEMGFLNINRYNGVQWNADDIIFVRKVTGILATAILRKRIEKELNESNTKFRIIVQQLSDFITITDLNGTINYVSPAGIRMLGYTPEEMIGRNALEFVHPDDLERAMSEIEKTIGENIPDHVLPDIIPLKVVDSKGKTIAVECVGRNALEREGVNGIILTFRDVTIQKAAEQSLIKAKEYAEESDRFKTSFLANMSHEIRTPLNGIVGLAEFLNDDTITAEERKEYVGIINNCSNQLVKLIDDIIVISQIEAKQMTINPALVELNSLMNEIYSFFETYLLTRNKKDIKLILDRNGSIDNYIVFVDSMRLQQVLTNLINNAIKFTEKGHIRFGYRQLSPNKLEFVVEDTGVGLKPEHKKVIFERFRQVELTNNRKYEGAGLGLNISYSLVQLMGGNLWVESEEGKGSTFYFTVMV